MTLGSDVRSLLLFYLMATALLLPIIGFCSALFVGAGWLAGLFESGCCCSTYSMCTVQTREFWLTNKYFIGRSPIVKAFIKKKKNYFIAQFPRLNHHPMRNNIFIHIVS